MMLVTMLPCIIPIYRCSEYHFAEPMLKRLSQAESYDTIYKCFTASIHSWS